MNKYKSIFKRNFLLMSTLVLVIILGMLVINISIKNKSLNQPNIGGSFELTDQNGKIFKSKLVKKKKLIYFGYTFCPDICPFDILKLSKFIDKNPSIANRLEFIFISVDPERDNVEQIKSFLENFNPSIVGLTGTQEQIDPIIKNFRIFVRKNSDSYKNKNYLVDHSSLFFLLDENDLYISHFRPDGFKSKIKDYL